MKLIKCTSHSCNLKMTRVGAILVTNTGAEGDICVQRPKA